MFDSSFSSYIESIYSGYINLMLACVILSGLLTLNIVFVGLHNYIFNAFLSRNYFFIPQRLNLGCHLVVEGRNGIRMSISNVPFKIKTWKN